VIISSDYVKTDANRHPFFSLSKNLFEKLKQIPNYIKNSSEFVMIERERHLS